MTVYCKYIYNMYIAYLVAYTIMFAQKMTKPPTAARDVIVSDVLIHRWGNYKGALIKTR